MLHTGKLILAAAMAALALPALAGNSWPQLPSTKGALKAPAAAAPAAQATSRNSPAGARASDFEYVDGEGGWQIAEHKYLLRNGAFEHSNECDHSYLSAATRPAGAVDSTPLVSPGA